MYDDTRYWAISPNDAMLNEIEARQTPPPLNLKRFPSRLMPDKEFIDDSVTIEVPSKDSTN